MNLVKSYDFFKPEAVKGSIHIIGCGSVGSTVAENLARCGLTNLVLWDFDTVESHNVVNQMFTSKHIGRPKVECLAEMLEEINPDIKGHVKTEPNGWQGKMLSGYIFLCVDNIELRQKIAKMHVQSPYVKAMFDFRTRLTDAQHYAADWSSYQSKTEFIASMDFTHDEAAEATPVSACNVSLSVAPTLRTVCAYGVANFMNFINNQHLKKIVLVDAFGFNVMAFD